MTDCELTMRTVVRTSAGLVRELNEDRAVVRQLPPLVAVADGMGGLARGDFAAGLIADRLAGMLLPEIANERVKAIDATLSEVNAQLWSEGQAQSCGSTIVIATIAGATVHVAWAGDSRAVRLRDGRLTPLNRDHSVVQELIDLGIISQAAARSHPMASHITRAVGIDAALVLEWCEAPVHAGDRLLLSSDGLHGVVDSSTLARLSVLASAEEAADALMAAAYDGGAPDNVTFIIVDLVPGPSIGERGPRTAP